MSLLDAVAAVCELIIEIGWAALVLGIFVGTAMLVWHSLRILFRRATWRVR